jgi:hypothetical protein
MDDETFDQRVTPEAMLGGKAENRPAEGQPHEHGSSVAQPVPFRGPRVRPDDWRSLPFAAQLQRNA